jgi:hypothetical protein
VAKISEFSYPSRWEDVNPENDNIDVLVRLEDGRSFSFLVATPNNIFWCMDNEGLNYFFGVPPLFVRVLRKSYVEEALIAICADGADRWLDKYGSLQK